MPHCKKGKRMKFRVLLTGKNLRIAANISDHLEAEKHYEAELCTASSDVLLKKLQVLEPRVMIVCLGNENTESARDYDVVLESGLADRLTVIVVANRFDFEVFKDNTAIKDLYFLSRPVSMEALYSRLEEIERKDDKKREEYRRRKQEVSEYDSFRAAKIKRKRILVVDDDKDQLMMIREHLSEFYDVRVVRSGEAALRYLGSHRADLMLLDHMMPEMDGPEVLRRIRESDEYPWVPVIFLTGVKEKDVVVKTLVELKPQGYIVKPAKKSELVAKIIEVIG